MYTGFYAAASGLNSQSKSLGVMSNNIANVGTSGYKKDTMVTTSFGELMQNQQGITFTSFEQGSISETGRTLDFSISGEGFFNILTTDGNNVLTRNGQFDIDGNGYLVDSKGNRVIGEKGAIMIGSADFNVDDTGKIYSGNNFIDTLKITCPADLNTLTKTGEGYYTSTNNEFKAFTGVVIQGAKELSNIDMAKEMADMMAVSRGFQSCSQMIKIFDQIMQKSANEVGRI